ncbi:G-protein beta WD-40 repeat-containing protein [Artemisia annua]|uniref:G-protein beta WD-40 repeat-containing protein n=1 Tax=Artemisia annua TaxID=35608 RepID=A0A2U1MNR6_ARTAN|nr:G-protein beta WD-40 repeat-containing protein [Artemisia annua]
MRGNRSEFCSDITSPLSDPGAFPRLMEHFSFQLSMGHLPWHFVGTVELYPERRPLKLRTQEVDYRYILGPVHLQSPRHRFVTSSKDGDARIWDATMRKTVIVLSGHTLAVTCVKWGRDGFIYTGSQDCTIKVWETTHGKLIRELKGHGHWVNSLALSTEYVLRTGAFDHARKHYSSPEEMKEAALERYNKMKGNAPERLVSGSDDFTMFLWEPSLVNHVYFSPDGQWIVSASFDKFVKLWNGITRKFVCAFRGHVGPIYQIRFPSFGEEYLTILFQSIREECETMQADS